MKLQIKLDAGAQVPRRKSKGAAGYDLCVLDENIVGPGSARWITTGVHIALPDGWHGHVRPRGSTSAWMIMHGTIDSDYRGPIRILACNRTDDPLVIEAGQAVAQLVLLKHEQPDFEVVDDLPSTERGAGWHGSTDRGPNWG